MYLDAEDKVSNVVAAAGRGVAARDLLSVDVGHDGDMLSNGQVQDVILVRERKLVPRCFNGRERIGSGCFRIQLSRYSVGVKKPLIA